MSNRYGIRRGREETKPTGIQRKGPWLKAFGRYLCQPTPSLAARSGTGGPVTVPKEASFGRNLGGTTETRAFVPYVSHREQRLFFIYADKGSAYHF